MATIYSILFSTAWSITCQWATSLSVIPAATLAIVPPITSVIFFEYLRHGKDRSFASLSARVSRIVAEAVIGLLFTFVILFLISLFLYAPPEILSDATAEAYTEGISSAQKWCRKEEKKLSDQMAKLQIQIDSDPLKEKWLRAERERRVTLKEVDAARNFAGRLDEAAKSFDKAAIALENSRSRQMDQMKVMFSLSDGLQLRKGVRLSDMTTEMRRYDHRKDETATAELEFRKSQELLEDLLREAPQAPSQADN